MRFLSFAVLAVVLSACGPDCEKTCTHMADTMGKELPDFERARGEIVTSCVRDCKAGKISKERAACSNQSKGLGELGLCDKTVE